MIELDLFGPIWIDFLNTLKDERIQNPEEDSILCFVNLEEFKKAPEDYQYQKFVGRISFPDEHMSMMKRIFWDLGVSNEYLVTKGYFSCAS